MFTIHSILETLKAHDGCQKYAKEASMSRINKQEGYFKMLIRLIFETIFLEF